MIMMMMVRRWPAAVGWAGDGQPGSLHAAAAAGGQPGTRAEVIIDQEVPTAKFKAPLLIRVIRDTETETACQEGGGARCVLLPTTITLIH